MTVEVCIYRIKESPEGWSLEVVDHEADTTVWEELFETDQGAFDEYVSTVERQGIGCFLRRPDDRMN